MASQIRFESAKPYWINLAHVLDQPYITSYNNWEGLAEKLDFKMREIEYIKTLRDDTGSCTLKMFAQYVQRTNGGDLDQVMTSLNELKREDALAILRSNYTDIKRRDDREQEQPILMPHTVNAQLSPQPQPQPTPRYASPQQLSPTHPVSPHQQVMYVPTAKQAENIPHHFWPLLDPNSALRGVVYPRPPLPPNLVQPQPQQQLRPGLQDQPIDLQKKGRDILSRKNKRTEEDFAPGFGQQLDRGQTDSISVQFQEDSIPMLQSGWTQESLAAMARLPPDRPSDFLDALMRGERQLDTLSHMPMVIAPTQNLQLHSPSISEPMEVSSNDSLPQTPTLQQQQQQLQQQHLQQQLQKQLLQHQQQLILQQQQQQQQQQRLRQQQQPQQQQRQKQYVRLPSGFIVHVENDNDLPPILPAQPQYQAYPAQQMQFPTLLGVVKQEPMDTDHLTTANHLQQPQAIAKPLAMEQTPAIIARESVIQRGPQCTSLPEPPTTDSSRHFAVTVKEEVDPERRLSSWPEYRKDGRKAHPESNRSTWPMSLSQFKRWKAANPGKSFGEALKSLSISVDRNYKQTPYKSKKPIKVFMTYAKEESKSHKKELSVLYNCLKKNNFEPSLDFMDPHEFNRDYVAWIDNKMSEADFVLVCVSPQYKRDVEPCGDSVVPPNIHTMYCRYIHKMLQTEFTTNNSQNKRFMPILFPGATTSHIPMWLQSTVAFRWRENWRDILYMMLEPNKIMDSIKRNQERFTPVIKMTQMCR